MSLKLTAASFLAGFKQSGLIEPDRVDSIVATLQQDGVEVNDSSAIASALVERKILTDWQAEKLLQGRHKGFILGRYRLLSLLGAGEMSAVYMAEHMMMERRCAIKVLPANKVQDTSYLARFHREAKAVASMNHVNIVRAYDVDKQTESGTDIHFLVMEYVEGKNLEQIVKDQGALDYITAVDAIRQAADGLAHAHQLGMVHRDVKPGNLLIDANGIVRLLDLGLARFFKSTEEESLTIKHDEKVLGTADYLAPEQAIDSHQVDSRADIYSLGCTLYFALTGHPPFTDGTLVQRLLAHQTKSPPSVRYERPDIDDSLLSILDKMMAKKTSDRFQTANDVSETLSRWLIQNAPSTWKQKHLMLVAALCGVDAIQNPNSQKNDSNGEVSRMTPSGPIATITETSQSATSDSDDKLIDPSSRSSNAVELKPRNKGAKSKGSKQKQRDSRPEVDSRRQLVSAASSVTETNLETGTSDTSNSSTQLSNRPVNLANGDLSTRPNSRGMTNTLSESTRTFMIAIAMLAVIIISVVGMYFLLVPPNAGNRVHLNEETEPVVGEHVVVPTQNSDT